MPFRSQFSGEEMLFQSDLPLPDVHEDVRASPEYAASC